MQIKKSGGKIFGATLTAAERKAMNIEINRQIAKSMRRTEDESTAIVMWILHKQFGFGRKRLRKFYENYIPEIRKLTDSYEMSDEDCGWLASHKLQEYGIDISRWSTELYGD